MTNPWFKFYGGEYLSDPKMKRLNGNERSCWITLLSYASQTKDGVVKYLTEEDLLKEAGVSEKLQILKKFKDLDMVTVSNEEITVLNWDKRQLSESTLRVRDFRRKQSGNADVTNCNDSVTTEESRREEKRIDKNRIEESMGDKTPSKEAESFFNFKEKYTELLEEFAKGRDAPELEKEFQKFILYWTEPNKSGTRQRWQQENTFEVKRRLFTWLDRSKNFSSTKKYTPII